jgi:hypothetical protein
VEKNRGKIWTSDLIVLSAQLGGPPSLYCAIVMPPRITLAKLRSIFPPLTTAVHTAIIPKRLAMSSATTPSDIGVPEDAQYWHRHISPKVPPHWVYSKPIQKSQQDDREYRLIRLDNGLQAMLVHDATADKAAASLDVAVGHLHDPVRAHFLHSRLTYAQQIPLTRGVPVD